MKARFPLFLLVCILASCQRNADIESVELPASKEFRTYLPKISKDIESLSASDAVKVADIFTNGGILTKSGAQKSVKSVVPVKGAGGEISPGACFCRSWLLYGRAHRNRSRLGL